MRGRLRSAGRVALALCVVAAVCVVGVLAVPGVVGAEESYVVLSGSMEPTIGTGDVVVVGSTTTAEISVGDVVTYRTADGRLVTHRVVDRRRTADGVVFRTKGDANEAVDPAPVPATRVVGTVRFHVPHAGHLVLLAHTPLGALLLTVGPGLLLVGSGLRTLVDDGD